MDIVFYKIVSGRNDLILINFIKNPPPDLEHMSRLTKILCHRRTGVGGNGLIGLFPGEDESVKLRYFRPDGEESVLINDALFCLARYIFDSAMGGQVLTVETIQGTRRVEILDPRNFRISLEHPYTYTLEPLKPDHDSDFSEMLILGDKKLPMVPIFLGKQGAVFLDGGQFRGRRKEISTSLKNSSSSKDMIHPVFVTIQERDSIRIDSPLDRLNADNASSCALGGMACVLSALTENEMVIRSRHSRFYFQWDEEKESVFLTGSADYAFSGSFYYDERD